MTISQRKSRLAPLVAAIVAWAGVIFARLGYDPSCRPRIVNLWANVNPRTAFNRGHVHPNTLWSGVSYVQTPEECGQLVFHDPRLQARMVTPRLAAGPQPQEAWSEVFLQAREGRLILFPSWLHHEVQPNLSPLEGEAGERISVSFNLVQARD